MYRLQFESTRFDIVKLLTKRRFFLMVTHFLFVFLEKASYENDTNPNILVMTSTI